MPDTPYYLHMLALIEILAYADISSQDLDRSIMT